MEDTNNKTRIVSLTVPPNAEAGVDSLTFQYEGNELEILIPAGSVAGEILQIQVGVKDDNNTEEKNVEDCSKDTKPTKSPSRSSLMDELGGLKNNGDISTSDKPYKDTKMPRQPAENGITTVEFPNATAREKERSFVHQTPLQLLEALPGGDKHIDKGDGTCSMVWPSGRLLAEALTSTFSIDFLKKILDRERNIKCLELGSGLGVVGLALCNSFSSENGLANQFTVVLSDIGEDTIKLLDMNIDRNRHLVANNMKVVAEELVWGRTLSNRDEKFQIILGSDLLYNTHESYDPLIYTIKHHLHPEHGIIILAVRWRKPDLERKFFERAEAEGICFELLNDFMQDNYFAKRSPCQLGWREYGNPKCEGSNRFFLETTISVGQSKTTALANITEADMERMSNEEHTIFEELQCQIYIGRHKGVSSRKRERDEHTTT